MAEEWKSEGDIDSSRPCDKTYRTPRQKLSRDE